VFIKSSHKKDIAAAFASTDHFTNSGSNSYSPLAETRAQFAELRSRQYVRCRRAHPGSSAAVLRSPQVGEKSRELKAKQCSRRHRGVPVAASHAGHYSALRRLQ